VSQTKLELVEQMQQAFESGRFDAALALLHPDVVYDARERPDGRIWHGRDGVRQAMREWATVWDALEVRAERYVEAGDDGILILWHERGRGRESNAFAEQRGGNLVTVAGDRIIRIRLYVDQERALDALGLT
jgi:ketosteroid isomerase-like protein